MIDNQLLAVSNSFPSKLADLAIRKRDDGDTPTRRLNRADLPTFGLPTIVTLGRR